MAAIKSELCWKGRTSASLSHPAPMVQQVRKNAAASGTSSNKTKRPCDESKISACSSNRKRSRSPSASPSPCAATTASASVPFSQTFSLAPAEPGLKVQRRGQLLRLDASVDDGGERHQGGHRHERARVACRRHLDLMLEAPAQSSEARVRVQHPASQTEGGRAQLDPPMKSTIRNKALQPWTHV
eukprot:6191557-Pleurochrysis_carterae.AAC.1